MARQHEWRRTTFADSDDAGFGSYEAVVLDFGETIIRSYWSFQIHSAVATAPGGDPVGSLLCRAGLVAAVSGLAPASTPTPISQPGDDWLDVRTAPWHLQLAPSTSTLDWVVNARIAEQDVKSQRRTDPASPTTQSIYWSWENGAGTSAGPILYFITGTVDALVLLAP